MRNLPCSVRDKRQTQTWLGRATRSEKGLNSDPVTVEQWIHRRGGQTPEWGVAEEGDQAGGGSPFRQGHVETSTLTNGDSKLWPVD